MLLASREPGEKAHHTAVGMAGRISAREKLVEDCARLTKSCVVVMFEDQGLLEAAGKAHTPRPRIESVIGWEATKPRRRFCLSRLPVLLNPLSPGATRWTSIPNSKDLHSIALYCNHCRIALSPPEMLLNTIGALVQYTRMPMATHSIQEMEEVRVIQGE